MSVRFSFENAIKRWLGSECESSKGIHDQIDPQKLTCSERRFSENRSSDSNGQDNSQVDSNLELKESANIVIDISTPLNSLNSSVEVILNKNNISNLLCS